MLTHVRRNNFDLLRLIAATLVFVSHCWYVVGQAEPLEKLTGGVSLARIGLLIFFLISGYLITMSWQKDSNPLRFIWKRFLRIFPGLAIVSLFTVFIIGIWQTTLSAAEYLSHSETYLYLFNNITLNTINNQLPGVFSNNPHQTVNEPLWTLPIEMTAYLGVLLIGSLIAVLRSQFSLIILKVNKYISGKALLMILTILSAIGLSYLMTIEFSDFETRTLQSLWLIIIFSTGSLLFIYKKHLNKLNKLNLSSKLPILLFLLIVWVLSWQTVLLPITTIIFISYLSFWAAFSQTNYFQIIRKRLSRIGDLSYGIYIYGFVLQQTVYSLFNGRISLAGLFIIAYPVTVFTAWLSWNIIESKALKLKKKSC